MVSVKMTGVGSLGGAVLKSSDDDSSVGGRIAVMEGVAAEADLAFERSIFVGTKLPPKYGVDLLSSLLDVIDSDKPAAMIEVP